MTTAIILSGGTGTRLKNAVIPKQYIQVSGKPVIWYVMRTVVECGSFQECLIVAAEEWRAELSSLFEDYIRYHGKEEMALGFADPGANRQLSIMNALDALEGRIEDESLVAVLDAARPKMSKDLLLSCIQGAKEADGAIPVLPMKDTVYLSEDGQKISGLLERKKLFAGQAPEVFRFRKYLEANRALLPDKILQIVGSTEPAILAGMDIKLVSGDEKNYKITTDEDLKRFQKESREKYESAGLAWSE